MFIYKNQEETLKAKKFTDSIFLSSAELRIDNNKWQQLKMDEIAPSIKYCKAGLLFLNHNTFKKIPEGIYQIKFFSLKTLSLEHNQISTIEQLGKLFAPSLQKIKLGKGRITVGNNNILSIKSIRKGNWEMLDSLSVQNNCVKDFPTIVNSIFTFDVESIVLQNNQNCQQICSDLSCLMKLKPLSVTNGIFVQRKEKISQKKVLNVYNKKIPNSTLHVYTEPVHHGGGFDFFDDSDSDFGDYGYYGGNIAGTGGAVGAYDYFDDSF